MDIMDLEGQRVKPVFILQDIVYDAEFKSLDIHFKEDVLFSRQVFMKDLVQCLEISLRSVIDTVAGKYIFPEKAAKTPVQLEMMPGFAEPFPLNFSSFDDVAEKKPYLLPASLEKQRFRNAEIESKAGDSRSTAEVFFEWPIVIDTET